MKNELKKSSFTSDGSCFAGPRLAQFYIRLYQTSKQIFLVKKGCVAQRMSRKVFLHKRVLSTCGHLLENSTELFVQFSASSVCGFGTCCHGQMFGIVI